MTFFFGINKWLSRCKNDDGGFTLVELVLVIIIAVVAMLPLISMLSNATVESVQPELITQAVFLAQEKMEIIVSDFHAPGRGYDYIIAANYPDEAAIPEFGGFARAVTVSGDSTFDSVTYKHVTVTVTHPAIVAVNLHTWVTD